MINVPTWQQILAVMTYLCLLAGLAVLPLAERNSRWSPRSRVFASTTTREQHKRSSILESDWSVGEGEHGAAFKCSDAKI